MKKLVLGMVCMVICSPLYSQNQSIAPTLSGDELLQFLRQDYSVTNSRSYSSARDAMFDDIDGASGTITCVYTGYAVSFSNRQDAQSKGFNTEHTWPQSFYDQSSPMRTDIHHLFPTRSDVNSARSNYDFDEIPDQQTNRWYRLAVNQSTIPGSNIDEWSEVDNNRFEPREDHKGNVARAMFYFWAIYQTNSSVVNDNTDNEAFFNRMKDVLLTWHDADPVDATEVARSNAIASVQGNQNPFVHDTTLVRRAFFGGNAVNPDPTPNPLTGKVTSIENAFFDVSYEMGSTAEVVRFTYSNSFEALDTLAQPFNIADYDSIQSARIEWIAGEGEDGRMANRLTVIAFEASADTGGQDTTGFGSFQSSDLLITGVIDGPLSGGTPKAVELFALEDIADLSRFAIGSANNGSGSDGVELILDGSASKGSFIYVATEENAFNTWFGFNPTLVNDFATAINGNDAIELFYDSTAQFSGGELVVDIFGAVDGDASSGGWNYANGWAYRNNFTASDSSIFNIDNWFFSGVDALNSESTNASASMPFPAGTYQPVQQVSTVRNEELPDNFELHQNYPNPFNPVTQISYTIDQAGWVQLTVYDALGRRISNLVNQQQSTGQYVVTFNASSYPTGIYFYQLSRNGIAQTRSMMLIK